MAHPELSHMPGILGQWAHNVCLSLLSLAIDSLYVIYDEDDLNPAAALSRREKPRALDFPVWRFVRRQLYRSLPASQFSIFICIASYDTKTKDILKPLN